MLNTLAHNLLIHEGSQWAVLNVIVVKGPLRTHQLNALYSLVFNGLPLRDKWVNFN